MIIISELFNIGLNLVIKISHLVKKIALFNKIRAFLAFFDKKPLFI